MDLRQSDKLQDVAYDVRGPLLDEAARMEAEGHRILKLNIGNPAPFGFEAPDEILQAVTRNLPTAQGYSESRGLYSARTAVEQYYQLQGIDGVTVDDIYLGNGVSELISMTLAGAAQRRRRGADPLAGLPAVDGDDDPVRRQAVHYRCDELADWLPDLDDLAAKVSDRTKALVVINPNNPTGAVYPREMLEALVEFARQHDLVILADEIYDKILYDGAEHTVLASLAPDVLCLTFSGLSKAYRRGRLPRRLGRRQRAEGARDQLHRGAVGAGEHAAVPQRAVAARDPDRARRLPEHQRADPARRAAAGAARHCVGMLNAIPGVCCTKPKGALYVFPRLDPEVYPIVDDERMALDLLRSRRSW